jgi:hypothetical protein
LDEQPISVCLGDPGPWVRRLAQAASGAGGVFQGHDEAWVSKVVQAGPESERAGHGATSGGAAVAMRAGDRPSGRVAVHG